MYTIRPVILVLVILLFFCGYISPLASPVSNETSLQKSPDIYQYLSENHSLIVEPSDGKTALISAIDMAKKSITLTIYELTDPDIIDRLIRAKNRGVQVRVIYNNQSFFEMNQTNPNNPAVSILSQSGVQVKPASPVFEVTHQKTLTIDKEYSFIMTFNLEPEYFNSTRDFGVITTDNDEVSEISRVFDADWNNQTIIPTYKSLVWSPVNSRDKILGIINNATTTLDVYNEEITDSQCIAALDNASDRGVRVRVIYADLQSNGKNENSPAIKTMSTHRILSKEGTTLYIHAKVILSDYQTPGQEVYIGSENLAPVSLNKNRELGILVSEPFILDSIESVFLNDWNSTE